MLFPRHRAAMRLLPTVAAVCLAVASPIVAADPATILAPSEALVRAPGKSLSAGGAGIDADASRVLSPRLEQNRGQAPRGVAWIVRGGSVEENAAILESGSAVFPSGLTIRPAGGDIRARTRGLNPLGFLTHSLRGQDPEAWVTGIASHTSVEFEEVWPGIDLIWRVPPDRPGGLRYDLVIAPGADPALAVFAFDGARAVRPSDGALEIETPSGTLKQSAPVVYQRTSDGSIEQLAARPVITAINGRKFVTFEIDGHDPERTLVIDPTLSYRSFMGGTDRENVFPVEDEPNAAVTVGKDGCLYVTGNTRSSNLPTTPGAVQTNDPDFPFGLVDAFVARLDATGACPLPEYVTYLGGDDLDGGYGIAVNDAGEAHVTGEARSTNFPVTPGAFQPGPASTQDGFVAILATDGASLLLSSYLGGSAKDFATDIALHPDGPFVVTGVTASPSLPGCGTPPNWPSPCDDAGLEDAFVTLIAPAAPLQVLDTIFLGGESNDQANGIAMDRPGRHVAVTGLTASNTFPATPGSYRDTDPDPGARDAFVWKLSLTAQGLATDWVSYLGGTGDDVGNGVAVDAAGHIHVAGATFASDFPVMPPAVQAGPGGLRDGFVSKLSSDGVNLLQSTYLGGSNDDAAGAIDLDTAGRPHVTGYTRSPSDFPFAEPLQCASCSGMTAFVVSVEPDYAVLTYSTLIGGSGNDLGFGIAHHDVCDVFVAGTTGSADFLAGTDPPAPYQAGYGGGFSDAFVTRVRTMPPPIGAPLPGEPSPTGGTPLTAAPGAGTGEVTVTFDPATDCTGGTCGPPAHDIHWGSFPASGSPGGIEWIGSECGISAPSHTFTPPDGSFFVVVSRFSCPGGNAEGPYGTDGSGRARPPRVGAACGARQPPLCRGCTP